MNPLVILAVLMGTAFLMPLFEKTGRILPRLAFLAALAVLAVGSAIGLASLALGGSAIEVSTSGFAPPMSINLRAGLPEAALWTASALILLVGGGYLIRRERDGMYDRMLFLIVALGVSGLILTRDLFNVFVFLEITSLGVYGLIGRGGDKSLQAGFKYMIAGGMASILFLIGTIFLYRITGTLNIDDMVASGAGGSLGGVAAASALAFLTLSFLIELKPFPANGWALDTYQSAPSGVGALLSSAQATAVFVAFAKVTPLLNDRLLAVVSGVGIITFFFANLIGMKQNDEKRMLGYSSTGQVGLALFAWTLSRSAGISESAVLLITGGFLLTHMFAKAGLFWLTGLFADSADAADGSAGSAGKTPFGRISAAVMAGLFVMALLGLPPFPSFFAKWELVKILIAGGRWWPLAALFLGSLFEAAYLFGWLVRRVKPALADGGADGANGDSLIVGHRIGPDIQTDHPAVVPKAVISGAAALWGVVPAIVLVAMSAFWAFSAGVLAPAPMASFAAALVLLLLAVLPGRLRGILAVLATAAAAYWVWPRTDGIDRIFAMLFLGGGSLNLFAGLYRKDKRVGFWAFSTMTVLASGSLVLASSPLEFFMAWEVVSVGVVLIVLQGRRASGPSRTSLLFALGGGYLLMTVMAAWSVTGGTATVLNPTIVIILAATAFLVKAGSLGLHLWLPGSYAEADDDASSLLSSVIGKVSIWAMMIFSIRLLPEMFGMTDPQLVLEYFRGGPLTPFASLLGWIGAITALGATLVAVFQEDIKYTLAWSSMGQVGYIILAFSLFDHFGWTTAIYLSLNHFLFKAMLFLAVAGIILRVKTRLMYKMGGLIAPMPITFISVLMAIIALSGVPPLSGFGGKWLVYSALIEGGRPLQAAVAMFASGIAFLYLFRLIHSMFLGQRKDDSVGIKEAPAWLIIPQVVLMALLMAVSSFPSIILKPVMAAVGEWMPASLAFEGSTLMGALGYWNGSWVMYVTMGVFILPLLILLIGMRHPRKVKQFNIVFAAERPHRPETTHYSHNFFAPYRKALGFLLKPVGRRFWEGTAAGAGAFSSAFRRLYTGNGQTYALHIVLFAVVVALFAGVIA